MSDARFDLNSIFLRHLPKHLVVGDDPAEKRLLQEYGAVFVARGGVTVPDRVVFRDETDVRLFQSRLDIAEERIGSFNFELQSAAMECLRSAIAEARKGGLTIGPRGADSARRDYAGTIDLWNSRVDPALAHWIAIGRLDPDEATRIRSLRPHEQVPEVFKLEADGIFFAKDLSKSIIYSVAPPGASQHLSLLAFDVAEFNDPDVRRILASNFWYQTVVSDLPHFTFLGMKETQLPDAGLKKVVQGDREFWVPALEHEPRLSSDIS